MINIQNQLLKGIWKKLAPWFSKKFKHKKLSSWQSSQEACINYLEIKIKRSNKITNTIFSSAFLFSVTSFALDPTKSWPQFFGPRLLSLLFRSNSVECQNSMTALATVRATLLSFQNWFCSSYFSCEVKAACRHNWVAAVIFQRRSYRHIKNRK